MSGAPLRTISVRKFASNAEAGPHEAEFWHALPAHERVLLASRLSLDQWELMGRKTDEPGLCRSVARLHRG